MDLFIYSDESGVFDKEHNEIYVYQMAAEELPELL